MDPAAEAHYRQGLALYARRDFPGALRELDLGYAIDPRPEFLFAEAQAHRLAGDCAKALPLYDAFLAASPTPVQIEATRLARARCADTAATAPNGAQGAAGRPPRAALPALATETPPERAPMPAPRAAWRDPWGLGSLGAGVAALGVGVGFAMASRRAQDDANAAATSGTYPEFTRFQDRAGTRHDIATVAFVAGGALATIGLIRLVYVLRRDADADSESAQKHVARPASFPAPARAATGTAPNAARNATRESDVAARLVPTLAWTDTPDGRMVPLLGLVGDL